MADATTGEEREGTCESCGDDGPVVTVRRVWVTPPAWDTEGSAREGGPEAWCETCRAHYPHRIEARPQPH